MSRRHRRTLGRRAALAAGALAVAAAGVGIAAVSTGLVVVGPAQRGALPATRADTSAGSLDAAPAPAPTLSPAPLVSPAPLDSLPAALPSARDSADSAVAHGAPATPAAPVAATGAELSALAASMIVPVAGVPRDRLVDSFDDARGTRSADGTPERRHEALDILAPRGTPVIAATAGQVLKLFDSRLGGLTVYTSEETGRFVLLYGHLDHYAPGLREGQRVARGDTLGFVGSTGDANPATPHLHFVVDRTNDPRRWWEGTPVNPYPLLRGR